MKNIYLFAVAVFISVSYIASAAAQTRCPAVDCNCSAIDKEGWRIACEAHQADIVEECVENNGVPLNYCRLHGPLAKPVAISIKPNDNRYSRDQDIEFLREQLDTLTWSIKQDMQVLQAKQVEGQLGAVSQIGRHLAGSTERLFHKQLQVLEYLEMENFKKERLAHGERYAEQSRALAEQLLTLSESLRGRYETDRAEKTRKALKVLSERLARRAAKVTEQGAHLHAKVSAYPQAAKAWQRAAEIAENLNVWEATTDDNAQVVRYYREQAAARWNRATYYWLLSNDSERAVVSNQNAERIVQDSRDTALVDLEAR